MTELTSVLRSLPHVPLAFDILSLEPTHVRQYYFAEAVYRKKEAPS